jgi:ribonuclease BN (tRNA processing enzyme)
MKYWIQAEKELPAYDEIFFAKSEHGQENATQHEDRKRFIWDTTRSVLNEDSVSRRNKRIQELKSSKRACNLCITCIHCETYYWEQLELVLKERNGNADNVKSEFLIPEDIKQLLEARDKPVDIYWDFYKRRTKKNENFLLMLKGFSSSTPMLLNNARNTNFYSGGGFYIQWKGVGIAVDPGYMFVQNLHKYDLSVLDIDVVVVTHEHIDHSSDIRLLDDLHCNVSRKFAEERGKAGQAFSHITEKPHKIRWYLDSTTYEEAKLFERRKSGFDARYNDLNCIMMENGIYHSSKGLISKKDAVRISENITMKVFSTRHEQYRDKEGESRFFAHTFGCVFECNDSSGEQKKIGYTSDTAYHPEILDEMHKLMQGCQVIIANISGIYKEGVLLKKGKERHLGYYGCYHLVKKLIEQEECKLRLYLLSEFTNMVSDIRFGVSRYMQREINALIKYHDIQPIAVIPTENGLMVNLSTFQIKCSLCNQESKKIHILRPPGENTEMQYICPDCIYSEEG